MRFEKNTFLCAVLSVVLLSAMANAADSPYRPGPGRYPRFDSKQAEPGVAYGSVPDLAPPKTLLYSVSPDELLADAEVWSSKGFNGFFLTGVAGEWSADVWSADGEPWTIGPSDKTFQKVKQANEVCRRLGCEVFLTMGFSRFFEWFNDTAWQRIEHNFRQFAIFARDTGCTGIALDTEYIYPQYHFNWEGYSYDGYTRKDLVAKIRDRMTRVASALYDEFPDMVFLTLPEGGFSLGSHVRTSWFEEAARREAPGGIHLCTEYTYRRPNIRYMLGQAWLNNHFVQTMLTDQGKRYWREKCSIAAGLWPFGIDPDDYHGVAPSLDEFRQAFAASLMVSARYNWIYSHNLRPFMLGRDDQGYAGPDRRDPFMRVIAERQVVTDQRYVDAAKDLRRMTLRDYAPELGLALVPAFAGPREEVEASMMPTAVYAPSAVAHLQDRIWDLGLRIYQGEDLDPRKELQTQTRWLLIGPFNNVDKQGYSTAYPPETELNLSAEYDGTPGKLRWTEYQPEPRRASINLAKIFQPSEQVCAYALCYVSSDTAREVEIRVGANDCWKLWVGGKPVYENADEGRVILDRDIIPVSLPAGTTPILLKVCNNKKDWGFIFRITDSAGKPLDDLNFAVAP